MSEHEKYMSEALSLAEEAYVAGEVPVGAVVIYDGEILSAARNRVRELRNSTAHAEMLAINEAFSKIGEERLGDCRLYVTLEPCPMCAGAIVLARIDQLYFGAYDAKWGGAGTLYSITSDERLNHQVRTYGGIMDSESSDLLKRFFEERR